MFTCAEHQSTDQQTHHVHQPSSPIIYNHHAAAAATRETLTGWIVSKAQTNLHLMVIYTTASIEDDGRYGPPISLSNNRHAHVTRCRANSSQGIAFLNLLCWSAFLVVFGHQQRLASYNRTLADTFV